MQSLPLSLAVVEVRPGGGELCDIDLILATKER